MMKLSVKTSTLDYDIDIGSGTVNRINDSFDLDRKVLLVTETGIPKGYVKKVATKCGEVVPVTVPEGERSKSLENLAGLLGTMLENDFTRRDAVVAVGGGVVGDLAGFAASCYMRGVDFYNVPTTLLSQLDSSVGGKTAVNFSTVKTGTVKNCVGAFWQPKGVIIDTDFLETLNDRQFRSGLAEAVKMAATSDREFFESLEAMGDGAYRRNIEDIIASSLKIKIDIVERDEREGGLRQMLNFGHTLGHAIEAASGMSLTHGECVGLGMIKMSGDRARGRIADLLGAMGLPTSCDYGADELISYMNHDKKRRGDDISLVYVDEIGKGIIKRESLAEFEDRVRELFG